MRNQAIAVVRKRIHEGVRRRVVGLADIADGACQRREHDERVEREIAARLIQIHGAVNLRAQHVAQILVRLAQDKAIAQHAGAVQDTVQPFGLGDLAHAGQHRGAVGYVELAITGRGTQRREFVERGLCFAAQR